MNYAIVLAPLLSLSAWQWSGLCHTEQTLNFLNQALSSWCQEKCPFPVSASSPPSNSLFAVWHLFLPQYWNYLSEVANDGWIAVKSNSFYALLTSASLLAYSSKTFLPFDVRNLVQAEGSTAFSSFYFWQLSSHLLALDVCIFSFSHLILFSLADSIQSHGFSLKLSLEIWSARPLLTHTLYEL